MLELLVLRHAKSSWKSVHLGDHDRPLNKRGKRDAPRMGKLMRRQELVPDLIITSSAQRAMDTAASVAEASGYEAEIQVSRDLYHALPGDYVAQLRQVAGPVSRVMVVGHNPGIAELVLQLSGVDDRMPTAALARIELPISLWQELDLDCPGRLVDIWYPREVDF